MITNKQELREYMEADRNVQPPHHNLIMRLLYGRMFRLKMHLRNMNTTIMSSDTVLHKRISQNCLLLAFILVAENKCIILH